jgi:hypothetical protein
VQANVHGHIARDVLLQRPPSIRLPCRLCSVGADVYPRRKRHDQILTTAIQSQPLDAKGAHRLRQRQLEDLQPIWTGATRQPAPRDFVLLGALALRDFEDVTRAVDVTVSKFCREHGNMGTPRMVGYFRSVLNGIAGTQAERDKHVTHIR